MILPERVFGSSGVKTMFAGFAIGPIFAATWSRSFHSHLPLGVEVSHYGNNGVGEYER